jgi:hypothetical protein
MSHSRYEHPLNYYPSVYGVSYRTVLRWAKKGFPLDDQAATRRAIEGEADSVPVVPPSQGLGLAASIRRLQEAEAQAHAEFVTAKQTGSESTGALQRLWLSLAEQLRKLEQSTPEIQEANKQTIKLSELNEVLGGLFSRLRQDLESLPRRVSLELVGQDVIAIQETLSREIGGIVASLHRCEYLEGGADVE